MAYPALEAITEIPFNSSPRPTLGVELEIQIVDPTTFNLTSGSTQILDRVGDHPKIKQELTQSTVEIITGICDTVADARADLAETLHTLYEIGDDLGFTFASAAMHPFAQWREQDIFPNERYEQLVQRIQWPARRLLIYGLHVHVGVGSGEKAIAVMNGLTTYLPHLLALSASSPFADHEDTGLASTRSKIFEGMPTAGLPYRLSNYSEFQQFMNTLIRAGAIHTVREIWWDIRPHPGFGTLEIRICDAPSTLTETMALVALVQSLVVWLSECYDKGHPMTILRPWIVRENKWRACRNGLDAVIITSNTGDQRPLREAIPALIADLESYAHELGCYVELQAVRRILQRGASYERQRVAHDEATGSELERLAAIVANLANELRADMV
ncbi:MAG: glutamate--cysteine ligase [Bacteroidota bacterium]